MTDPADDFADRLDALAEELGEAALTELKAALSRGESQRPPAEKALTQARRAVEKASHVLRRHTAGGPSADLD